MVQLAEKDHVCTCGSRVLAGLIRCGHCGTPTGEKIKRPLWDQRFGFRTINMFSRRNSALDKRLTIPETGMTLAFSTHYDYLRREAVLEEGGEL